MTGTVDGADSGLGVDAELLVANLVVTFKVRDLPAEKLAESVSAEADLYLTIKVLSFAARWLRVSISRRLTIIIWS